MTKEQKNKILIGWFGFDPPISCNEMECGIPTLSPTTNPAIYILHLQTLSIQSERESHHLYHLCAEKFERQRERQKKLTGDAKVYSEVGASALSCMESMRAH